MESIVSYNPTSKTDTCALRMGGGVETKIRAGKGNVWVIDENHTIPILRQSKIRGATVVLVTKTKHSDEVLEKCKPDVFSNREHFLLVFQHLTFCRCLFISAGI